MRNLIVSATLLFMFTPLTGAAAQGLQDFARFSKAIGKEVVIVDHKGLIREGVVEAATGDSITLRFGSATQVFARAEIARADRLRDSPTDGAIKGAAVGLALALTASLLDELGIQYYPPTIAMYAGIGFAFDVFNVNRQTFYRTPAAVSTSPSPALKFSLRF